MVKPLKIAFMGTPDFAATALQMLIDSDHDVVCVYSQPPRPKGRGNKVQPAMVHVLAQQHNIEVRTPINFKNEDDVKAFADLDLDVAVVAAYGLILPKALLDAPKYGCLNIHASLLPRWRGAAPIHRAILAGDKQTGVTIMQMDVGLDTGDMIKTDVVDITNRTTLMGLHDQLANMGGRLIVETLNQLSKEGALSNTKQSDEGVTYADKINKEEGKIDWSSSAFEIDRQIRALNPWPGAWCFDSAGKRLKIISGTPQSSDRIGGVGQIIEGGDAICGENTILSLNILQPENKKPMSIEDAINGGILKLGEILS